MTTEKLFGLYTYDQFSFGYVLCCVYDNEAAARDDCDVYNAFRQGHVVRELQVKREPTARALAKAVGVKVPEKREQNGN